MPSHMRDGSSPQPTPNPQPSADQTPSGVPQIPRAGQPQQAPDPDRTQQAPRPEGARFATDGQPSPYANDPQEIDLPERRGPRLWWAWVILAAIVVVGVIWIWFFVIPHPEGSYEDVQGVEQGEVAEGDQAAEGDTSEEGVPIEAIPENGGVGIGSTGPHELSDGAGTLWDITDENVITPIEIHGIGNDGVTIAFFPPEDAEQVDCRVVSVAIGGETFEAGTEGSPVTVNITAGPEGRKDISADPTFSVGNNGASGAYGQRVLIGVTDKGLDQLNGAVITIDETPLGGETTTGTITISSSAAGQ